MNYMIKGEKCMKKIQKTKTLDYDFSDYAEEITGNALFKINGGAQIENSIEAQANAKVGDTVTRKDGTTHTLYQGDIDWALKEMAKKETKTPASGSSNNTSTGNISTGNTASKSSHNQSVGVSNGPTTITEKKAPSPAIMYDSHDPSRVFVDLDNPKAMQQAADLLADLSLGLRVTAYGSESGITKNFYKYSEINDYLESIRPKTDGGITVMDVVGGISTATGVSSDILNYLETGTKASNGLGKISTFTGAISTVDDVVELIKNPSFSNFLDLVIDGIGFKAGGGALLSLGLSVEKEKLEEETSAAIASYKDYKIKDTLYKFVPSQNNDIFFDQDYFFMKGISNQIKEIFRGN